MNMQLYLFDAAPICQLYSIWVFSITYTVPALDPLERLDFLGDLIVFNVFFRIFDGLAICIAVL